MDESQLEGFLSEASGIISDSSGMDEANTKAKVIRPFLETLGWNIATDAKLEYGFQMGSSTHRVDYALTLDGSPELFVEAKGSHTDLTDRHREQLSTYMQTQNVDWGLLTNGQSYFICRRRIDDDNRVVVDVLADFELEELIDHSTLVSALSKQSIVEGRSEEIAANIYELRESYATLKANREAIAEDLTDVFVDELGDQITSQAESAARTAIDHLAEVLESDAESVEPVDSADTFWSEVESAVGIVKQGSVVAFPESKTAAGCFAEFVDFLFQRGYLSEGDVPIESGRKRYLINDRPYDKEGDEMFQPKEVGNGHYLETNYSKNDIKQWILKLAERCREET